MHTVLIVILIALTALLLAMNVFYAVQRFLKSRMFRARKQARAEERTKTKTLEKAEGDSEISEELLLVLISAAVAATYSQRSNVRFRVVSFGRIGKK
jgi:hypothetical protein